VLDLVQKVIAEEAAKERDKKSDESSTLPVDDFNLEFVSVQHLISRRSHGFDTRTKKISE
jgi:hypothetical protein